MLTYIETRSSFIVFFKSERSFGEAYLLFFNFGDWEFSLLVFLGLFVLLGLNGIIFWIEDETFDFKLYVDKIRLYYWFCTSDACSIVKAVSVFVRFTNDF